MASEAVQAQAGHASIESTRIYLHLADGWLASQYRRAAEAIDAQVLAGHPLAPGAGGARCGADAGLGQSDGGCATGHRDNPPLPDPARLRVAPWQYP